MLCSLYEGQWKRKNTVHHKGSIYYAESRGTVLFDYNSIQKD